MWAKRKRLISVGLVIVIITCFYAGVECVEKAMPLGRYLPETALQRRYMMFGVGFLLAGGGACFALFLFFLQAVIARFSSPPDPYTGLNLKEKTPRS